MTQNHTEMKHRSVQGPTKYGIDREVLPGHQESYAENQIFLFASLLITLYQCVPNDSHGDELTGAQ